MSRTTVPCWCSVCLTLLMAVPCQAQLTFVDDVEIAPQPAADNPSMMLTDDQFESLLRNIHQGRDYSKNHLESRLQEKLASIDAICSLTNEQRSKLQMAGRRDILRLVDELSRLRAQYVQQPIPEKRFMEIQTDIYRRGAIPLVHPFTEGSMFDKVLRTTLDEKQYARFEKSEREARLAAIQSALKSKFITRTFPASLKGREPEIAERILKKYPEWRPVSPYSPYVVALVFDEMQDDSAPLFNAEEWEQAKPAIKDARDFEPTMRLMSLWPLNKEDDPQDEK